MILIHFELVGGGTVSLTADKIVGFCDVRLQQVDPKLPIEERIATVGGSCFVIASHGGQFHIAMHRSAAIASLEGQVESALRSAQAHNALALPNNFA